MSNDIAKLPKWARQEIELLRKEIEGARAELALHDSADSPVVWDKHGRAHGIPPHATVTFGVSGGELDFLLRDGFVRVIGSDLIRVSPRASNSILLSIDPNRLSD